GGAGGGGGGEGGVGGWGGAGGGSGGRRRTAGARIARSIGGRPRRSGTRTSIGPSERRRGRSSNTTGYTGECTSTQDRTADTDARRGRRGSSGPPRLTPLVVPRRRSEGCTVRRRSALTAGARRPGGTATT